MGSRIVVIGSLNMDLVVKVPRHPLPGETVGGSNLRMIPGGKGANQAVAVARLGVEVSMIGKVGRDGFGEGLLASLDSHGVHTDSVLVDPEQATGVALIAVHEVTGQNSIVLAPGANSALRPENLDRHRDLIAGADAVLLQLEIPVETVAHAVELAWRHGVRVILNPAPAPAEPFPDGLLTKLYAIVPNENEAFRLTGRDAGSPEGAVAAAAALRQEGVPVVIVTLGEKGALLADGEGTLVVPARPVQAVDTTAAGDAFIGGFATGLILGYDKEKLLTWACGVAALSVTRFGAQTSLPIRREVEEFLEKES